MYFYVVRSDCLGGMYCIHFIGRIWLYPARVLLISHRNIFQYVINFPTYNTVTGSAGRRGAVQHVMLYYDYMVVMFARGAARRSTARCLHFIACPVVRDSFHLINYAAPIWKPQVFNPRASLLHARHFLRASLHELPHSDTFTS